MAEKSTFFNSVNGDRKYKAEEIALHFAKLLTNGVFPSGTQLQATENVGMTVLISAGSAWINGYAYHNDADFILTHDAADGVLHRIDRIVVRWSRLNRSINLTIAKGTPASSPVAPPLTRTADTWELSIATVLVSAGITGITQAMITDTRMDSSVCGFVSSLIEPDTSGWFAQFESEFNNWFTTVQNTLDGDTAGNLLNQINGLAGSGRTTETVKGNADALAAHKAETAVLTPQAGSTANAVILNIVLADKKKGTFRASANNTGNMTINGKAFKKDTTTEIPTGGVKANRVYDFYYDQTADCVFILAKASGNAQPSDVLAGKIFSNDDGEQVGTNDIPTEAWYHDEMWSIAPAKAPAVLQDNPRILPIDNAIYAIQGSGCYMYDPTTDTWTTKASTTYGGGNVGGGVINGKIYYAGSTTGEYDPATNTWAAKAAIPTNRTNGASIVLRNKLHVIGGGARINNHDVYNPTTNLLETAAVLIEGATCLSGVTINDYIYICGGIRPINVAPWVNATKHTYCYDPNNNLWALKADMLKAKCSHAVAVKNNQMYAICGSLDGSSGAPALPGTTDCQKYDPATNQWSQITDTPTPRIKLGCGILNNKIYAMGGLTYDRASSGTTLNLNINEVLF